MQKYLLELAVFVCGAVVMILELVGSRILAPFLGNSLFVCNLNFLLSSFKERVYDDKNAVRGNEIPSHSQSTAIFR